MYLKCICSHKIALLTDSFELPTVFSYSAMVWKALCYICINVMHLEIDLSEFQELNCLGLTKQGEYFFHRKKKKTKLKNRTLALKHLCRIEYWPLKRFSLQCFQTLSLVLTAINVDVFFSIDTIKSLFGD